MREDAGSVEAHVRRATDEPMAHLTEDGRPHALVDHLKDVATLAARFAEAFGAAERAGLACGTTSESTIATSRR
jgi:hypothetical protein